MPHSSRNTMSGPLRAGIIPVWAGSFGSWNFSIGRRPFAASELEGHYDKASDSWQTTVSRLGFESAYAGLAEKAMPEVVEQRCCDMPKGIYTIVTLRRNSCRAM